jgi:hypothetical protein
MGVRVEGEAPVGPENDNPTPDPFASVGDRAAAPAMPVAPPPGPIGALAPSGGGASGWALPEQQAAPSAADQQVRQAVAAGHPGAIDQGGQGPNGSGPTGGAPADWHEAPRSMGPPTLPVPLKPMTISDILDGAWAIIKSRPKTVLALTAIIILPVQLIAAYLQRDVVSVLDALNSFNSGSIATSRAANPRASTLVASYAAQALVALSYYFLGFAIARLVSAWYAGGDMTVKQVLVATGKKAHFIIATFLLLLIPIAASVLMCYVPALFVVPLFLLTMPVMAVEDANPWTAATRSCKLVARRLWWVMLFWFSAFLLESLVNYSIQAAPEVIALISPDLAKFFVPIGAAAARFTTAPFVVGVPVLIYLDLRVRTEGLDLDLEVADAFAGAA